MVLAALGASGSSAFEIDIKIFKMSLRTSVSEEASLNNFMGSWRSGDFTEGSLAGEYDMTGGSRRTIHDLT